MSSRSRPNPRSAPLELVAPRKQPLSAVLVEIEPQAENEEGLAPVPLFLAGEEDRGESEEAEFPGAEIVALSPEKQAKPRRSTTAAKKKVAATPRKAGAATAAKTAARKAPGDDVSVTAVPKTRKGKATAQVEPVEPGTAEEVAAAAKKNTGPEVRVRRLHRRDLNRTWEFLKLVFRDVNRETVEYQRPRSKRRFFEVYEEEGEQLLFEVEDQIVGYAECAFDASGVDNWINPRYFEKRGMRPLYVDELAVHPAYQGKGVGGFMLDQLQHLARVRGCTHLVLEVAENNNSALTWYRRRNFFKLDAAIFLAQKVPAEPELLPPRRLPQRKNKDGSPTTGSLPVRKAATGAKRATRASSSRTTRKR